MRLKHILNPNPIVESQIKVGTMFMVHGYPLLKGLFPSQYYKVISINGDEATLEKVNFQGKETNLSTAPVTHKLSSIEASLRGGDNSDMNGLEIVNEATASEVIKDLDKVKNDLLKKVEILVAKKKKLYSNVDIESPMSADEKKLDKEIADLFSQIQQLIRQKRSIKEGKINELTQNEKRIKEGNPNNVFYVFYKGKFEAVYWAMNSSDLFKIYWDQFKVRRPAGSQFKLNPEFIIVSKKEYDTSTSNRYAKLKPYVDKFWDKLQNESVNEGISKDAIVRTLTSDKNAYFLTKDGNGWILDITPKGAQHSTFHQKFTVKDMGKGHLGMKYKLTESHDCGCNENHDCGCGGLHEHHINEDINADANGIAGLTTSRANAVKDFIEKHKLDSNKLYQFLKKGGLKDKMDFVTALVGKPGNPIQTKLIKQFSK